MKKFLEGGQPTPEKLALKSVIETIKSIAEQFNGDFECCSVIPSVEVDCPIYAFTYDIEIFEESGEVMLSSHKVIALGCRLTQEDCPHANPCPLIFDAEHGVSCIDEADNFVGFAESPTDDDGGITQKVKDLYNSLCDEQEGDRTVIPFRVAK